MTFRISKLKTSKESHSFFPEKYSPIDEAWYVIIKREFNGHSMFFTRIDYSNPLTLEEARQVIDQYQQWLSNDDEPPELEVIKIID